MFGHKKFLFPAPEAAGGAGGGPNIRRPGGLSVALEGEQLRGS